MIESIKWTLDRAWFSFRCKGIFKTPLVKCDPQSKVVIVSQLHHPDVTMYVLAAKSFSRFVKPREFVIVDDGLRERDRSILKQHFESIRFVSSAGVRPGTCPVGGCWERLLTLSQENESHYVIQLDADTLTVAKPKEVLECIAQDRTFTLGTMTGRHVVGFEEAAQHARKHTSKHVQNRAEAALGDYPGKEHRKYVRGCAGFTGFAKGQLSADDIVAFSANMENLVGRDKWREWGSEQVTSNYMAANAPESLVLPVERYPFWKPGLDLSQAVFVHFFGTFRFVGGTYMRQSLQLIEQLGD
jgi:hypothetical protein